MIRDRKKSLIVIFCCVMVASLAVFIGIGMARKGRTDPAFTQNYENDVFYENTVESWNLKIRCMLTMP